MRHDHQRYLHQAQVSFSSPTPRCIVAALFPVQSDCRGRRVVRLPTWVGYTNPNTSTFPNTAFFLTSRLVLSLFYSALRCASPRSCRRPPPLPCCCCCFSPQRRRYHIILNRDHDSQGFVVNLAAVRASGREFIYNAFVQSAEFLGDASLKDRANFVARVYLQLLQRAATSSEIAQVLQASAYILATRTPFTDYAIRT